MPCITEQWSYIVDIKQKNVQKFQQLHFKRMNLFWCVNLCRGSSKLLSSHNAQELQLQYPVAFFLQGWVQTKSRLIYWIRETISLVTAPHCLRKWTRSMNDQCQILHQFTSVIHVRMSVCMWPLSRTFTLELYQETLCQKAPTWNLRLMFQFRSRCFMF